MIDTQAVDTELLRTFLEVNRTRHFGRAAANLYLTQSAVSSRIRMLEQIVGVTLFVRERNDIQLTPEGRKLQKHAETILTAWNRARQEIAVQDEGKSSLNLGVSGSLVPVALDGWILGLRQEMAELVLNTELLEAETMVRRLGEKTLDIALSLDPPQGVGLKMEELTKIDFVLATTAKGLSIDEAVSRDYTLVNWGNWFTVIHAKHFPELPTPSLRVDLGGLARRVLLQSGGSAYLARTMIKDDLKSSKLHLVKDAPVISRTICATYPSESENRHLIEPALEVLKSLG